MKNLLMALVVFLVGDLAWSSCLRIESESLDGLFEVLEIGSPILSCKSQASPKSESVDFIPGGCVVSLRLIKVVSGLKPKITVEKDDIFKIYQSAHCTFKQGDRINKKLRSVRTECCAVRQATFAKKYICDIKSGKPELIGQISDKEIRCNQDGIRWEAY